MRRILPGGIPLPCDSRAGNLIVGIATSEFFVEPSGGSRSLQPWPKQMDGRVLGWQWDLPLESKSKAELDLP